MSGFDPAPGSFVADDRDVDARPHEADLAVEGALRPTSLDEFVGQAKVRGQLQLLLRAAEMQQRPPDHILLAGPPGLGKTTLAMIVAHEGGRPLRLSSGPAIQHAGDLAALLCGIDVAAPEDREIGYQTADSGADDGGGGSWHSGS